MAKGGFEKMSKFRLTDGTEYTERDVITRFCTLAWRKCEMETKCWKRRLM